ncbi:MAG: FkbM family methyltransferase [Nitrososphaerota archaeon]|jgi:FkbM family methyltransferase|nr:FkbM family methyltransferase [Nitrososphaerota archaeon]
MVTVKRLVQTLSIVKNPVTILTLKLSKKPSKITFPDGEVFQVTWPQFRLLRDCYINIKNCHIHQISDDAFKITTDNYQLIGSRILIDIVIDMESGAYEYDYQGKTVLDVGGFEGESAVFFWSRGAKKIVIYEPVLEHHPVICENIRLNNVNAEIHSEGIGDGDGERVVAYDKTDWGFGLETEGSQNRLNIKIKDVSKVIVESGADVAKFDCEGAELSLVSVSKETLRKLEYVIVEFHTRQIRQQLIEKFKSSGFTVHRDSDNGGNNDITVIHFKRNPNA